LLQENVGFHAGVIICKKSPAKAAVAITAGKCQEVAALCHEDLVVIDFATLLGGAGESFFKVKKLPNCIKDLNTVQSGKPKQKKQTIATKKPVATTTPQNR
jgi:hypothetical protein